MKTAVLFVLALWLPLLGQGAALKSVEAPDSIILSAGLRVQVAIGGKGNSYFSASLAFGASKPLFKGPIRMMPAYQATFNLYSGGPGDNILANNKKGRLDFVNSLSITSGLEAQPADIQPASDMLLLVGSFNQQTATVIENPMNSSLTLGTSFIFNGQNRNQQIGFGDINVNRTVHFVYYNDAIPFNWFFLGDAYDRWWSGGGVLELFLPKLFKDHYLSRGKIFWGFDRFTGNVQNAYVLSKFMSFRYIPVKDEIENFFNQSSNKWGYTNFDDNYTISFNLLGPTSWDVQNWLHDKLGFPRHITLGSTQRLVVFEYQRNFFDKNIDNP